MCAGMKETEVKNTGLLVIGTWKFKPGNKKG